MDTSHTDHLGPVRRYMLERRFER